MKTIPDTKNPHVNVNTERLVKIMGELDIDDREVEDITGLTRGHVAHIMRRGACRMRTIERLASSLYVRDTDLIVLEAVAS